MSFHLPGEATITRQRKVDSKLIEFADANRSKGLFNDVVIKVENESFPANRLVLACYSHYFETMFTVEMMERYENTVKIDGVDVSSWKVLFKFIYTGSIVINCANVIGLLAVADYLQVDDAKDFCFEFIESVLSVDNCFNVLNVANMYSNACLQKKVFDFISLNFVSQHPSLKTLSENDFTLCVSNLNVNVVDNCLLFEAVIDWVKVDEENRKHNLPKLLSCLDFSKMPERFFEQKIATERLIIDNSACAMSLLRCTIKLLSKKVSVSPPRKIFSVNKEMLVYHEDDSSIKVSLIYNLFNDVPQTYPDVPVQNIDRFCALKCNDFVYFIGGKRRQQPVVWRLNVREENSNWEEMAPMLVQRENMAASVLRNMIVVAGGDDDQNSAVNSAEVYDASLNQWQAISSLNQKRCFHELVTCEDCVYALGGCHIDGSFSSVEKLSDIEGKWRFVQPMSGPRQGFAAVTCEGKIYAIGGYRSRSGDLNSVERYCPQSDEWVTVSSMNDERFAHSACVLQGKIYVVGGEGSDDREVNSIECYDPSRDQWKIVGRFDGNYVEHSMFVV